MAEARIRLVEHAVDRARERGATLKEIEATILGGRCEVGRHGRSIFSRTFSGPFRHGGRDFDSKRVEAYAAREGEDAWVVVTVIVKYQRRRPCD